MTIKELFDYVNEIRPNSYGNQTKLVWVNEIEGAVQTEIMGILPANVINYKDNVDLNTTLLIGAPHAKLYAWYMIAMIDLVTMGSGAFENSQKVFRKFWDEYARWYLRTHRAA
ncbi:MAG: hypothetical protein IIW17_03395 [Clostridia bacterium]|nr:hypothetical protein [Clostridia bacterium]MBQ5793043.1 hypothetical protein [Clostridia bacterium]